MRDTRVDRLAELIVGYSLELAPGQLLEIEGADVAAPLIAALHLAALTRGANPYVKVGLEGLDELLLAEATDEQLTYISPMAWRAADLVDAWITIWASTNTRSLTRADPVRRQRLLATQRKLSNRRWDRIERGGLTWCGTIWPTHAHAQDAEMSLAEYERFVYAACHVLEGEDPVAHWQDTAAELEGVASRLGEFRELRIVGPDTDLTVVVEGRTWIAGDGKLNMPDGEVFTSPVEAATEGEIRFTYPAVFEGREVEDVRLRFARGRVVAAEAADGLDYLEALLDMDEGARIAGELAFGLNYEIDRFTRNILFDEKIGGTIHLALGSGFKEAGGSNRSGLHWDLICDLRAAGEVYGDGELIWRAGSFLEAPEPTGGRVG